MRIEGDGGVEELGLRDQLPAPSVDDYLLRSIRFLFAFPFVLGAPG